MQRHFILAAASEHGAYGSQGGLVGWGGSYGRVDTRDGMFYEGPVWVVGWRKGGDAL